MPAAMRENVEVLRDLFAGSRVSRRGTHVTCDGFRLVAGAQDVTITVAAFAPSMLRLAARIADRVVINLSTPQQAARAKAAIVAAAAQAGRTPPPLAAWIPAAADASDATIAQLARQLVVYLAPPGYGEMFIDAGFGEIVDRARAGTHPRELLAAIPRELIDAVAAVGNEARVRDRIDEFVTAGVDEVAIVPVTAADEAGRRLLQTLAPR